MRRILCIIGPTASGKSARAVEEALAQGGEVISADSRQVYRGLDIGTEKITREEMRGIPHHLINIRAANDPYSAGDFAADAARLIEEISARGKLPILAGGTHFYFDALLKGLPAAGMNAALREELAALPTKALAARLAARDPRRAEVLDPNNRRRLIRAIELAEAFGVVPPRGWTPGVQPRGGVSLCANYDAEWIVVDLPREELRARIEARLERAFARGLVEEVHRVREEVGDARLAELGLEYRVIGEYLRGERSEASLLPALLAKLWQYARRQKAWLRKLHDEIIFM